MGAFEWQSRPLFATDLEEHEVSWPLNRVDSDVLRISQSGIPTVEVPPDQQTPSDSDQDDDIEFKVKLIDVTGDGGSANTAVNTSVDVTMTSGAIPHIGQHSESAMRRNLEVEML